MSKPTNTNFRDLKTSFEARSNPTTASSRAFHRSLAGDLANNMSADNKSNNTSSSTRRIPSIAKSIDQVLDTPTPPPAALPTPPIRPQAKLKPSWIGPPRPERPVTPGVQAMKQHVTISYSSHGLQPPVYIFTDLSDPAWEAIEMHREQGEHGEHAFSKEFHVEEGEYQYKFRLGPGDWWACDDGKPTVDDGKGNKNNLVVVKPQTNYFEQPSKPKDSKAASPASLTSPTLSPAALKPPAIVFPTAHADATPTPAATATAMPLLKHEAFVHDESSQTQHTPEREQANLFTHDDEEAESSHALMKHETFAPNTRNDEDSTSDEDDDSDTSSSSSSDEDEGDEDDEPHASPLLRHESLSPISVEQEHSPLFRHESIGIGYNHHESPATTARSSSGNAASAPSSIIPAEAGHHDQHLEKFPTDHAGIMDKIRRCSNQLAEDESTEDEEDSDGGSRAVSESPSSPLPALPSVDEAEEEDDEELEKIREAEEERFDKEEAEGEEMDPLNPGAPNVKRNTDEEHEDADFQPKVVKHTKHGEEAVEQAIVIEIVEEERGFFDKLGGRGIVVAVAVGVFAVAAGVYGARFL